MPEFKIESDALRRGTKVSVLSWGTVLLLLAAAALLFALGVSGYLGNRSIFGGLFVFAIVGAAILAIILAPREGLRRAEREMVFVLDDKKIVRKRQGFPEVVIPFSEVKTLREELRWLVITSNEPYRKIGVSNSVSGYEVIRAELAKHHELSASQKMSFKKFGVPVLSVLGWVAFLRLHDLRAVILAGSVALISLAISSYRLWNSSHRGPERKLLLLLGLAWFTAILLIYFRMARL